MQFTKVTEEVQIQICAMVSVGCSVRAASRMTGCAESTVRNLLKRNKAFAARLRKSQQSCEIIALRHVQAAGEKNWRAAAWLLERMCPTEYAPPKLEVMQPYQVKHVIDQFGDVLLKEIKDPKDRKAVGVSLRELTNAIVEREQEHRARRNAGER